MLFKFRFIFETAVDNNLKEFKDVVARFLPRWIETLFKFSLSLDYMMFFVVYSVVSWNLFEYILVFANLYKDAWIDDSEKITFHEFNFEVILLRIGFFVVIYCCLIPLLLKRSLESLKYISMLFLSLMITLLLFILIELPNFYSESSEENKRVHAVEWILKQPSGKFIVYFFSFLLFFYAQPFILSFRKELLLPSFVRLNKVSYLSLIIECLIYMVFGTACYATFGDNHIPGLMILRKSYKDKNVIIE